MTGRAHTQKKPRSTTRRNESRKPGGVALNPIPPNHGGANLAYSDWAVSTSAPSPNLKTLAAPAQNLDGLFGVKGGQRRREKNSKAEKYTEFTENPFKIRHLYEDKKKKPNESNLLIYSLPLIQSTGVSQNQLKRHVKAEDFLAPFANRFDLLKIGGPDPNDTFYRTYTYMNLDGTLPRAGLGQRKKRSKAEKLVRQQQKLISPKEPTEQRIRSNEFPTLKTLEEAKAEKIQLVSSKESTEKRIKSNVFPTTNPNH
jgi:hypothetical protein